MNDMLERYFANREVENKTESVIKALDICCPEYLSCDGCLYGIKHPNSSECVHALLKDARDLIIELEQNRNIRINGGEKMKEKIRCKVKLGKTVKHREEKDAYFVSWFMQEDGAVSRYGLLTNHLEIKGLVIIADTGQAMRVDPEDIYFVDFPFEFGFPKKEELS